MEAELIETKCEWWRWKVELPMRRKNSLAYREMLKISSPYPKIEILDASQTERAKLFSPPHLRETTLLLLAPGSTILEFVAG